VGEVIVITSGKGGTGKTSLTAGLGAALARLGRRVLCIDCDVGLRNLDLSLGMSDAALMDFTDVLAGRSTLNRAAVAHPAQQRLYLLTAPLTLPDPFPDEEGFRGLLAQAREEYDLILLDCPAGLGPGFRLAVCGADRAIVVSQSDPACLRDAQRVVLQLAQLKRVHLVVNRVRARLLRRLGTTIDDAMDTAGLPLLGIVPEDTQVVLAAGSGRLLPEGGGRSASAAYRNIALRLIGRETPVMHLR